MMHPSTPALFAAAVLAGCTSLAGSVKTVDEAVQRNLPAACSLIAQAHASFVVINAAKPLKPSVVEKEAAAMAAVATVCADPAKVTAANALVVAANAYAAVAAALREAEKAEN